MIGVRQMFLSQEWIAAGAAALGRDHCTCLSSSWAGDRRRDACPLHGDDRARARAVLAAVLPLIRRDDDQDRADWVAVQLAARSGLARM